MKKNNIDITLSEKEKLEIKKVKNNISKGDFSSFITLEEFSKSVNERTKKYKGKN